MAPLATMAAPILTSGLKTAGVALLKASPLIAGGAIGMYGSVKVTHRLTEPHGQVAGSERQAVARRVFAWIPAVAGGALLLSSGRGMAVEAGRWTMAARTVRMTGVGAIAGAALATDLLQAPISWGSQLIGDTGTKVVKAITPDWMETAAQYETLQYRVMGSAYDAAKKGFEVVNGGQPHAAGHSTYTVDLKPGQQFDPARDLKLKVQPEKGSLDTVDSYSVRNGAR